MVRMISLSNVLFIYRPIETNNTSVFATFERKKQKQADKKNKLLHFSGFRKNVDKTGKSNITLKDDLFPIYGSLTTLISTQSQKMY